MSEKWKPFWKQYQEYRNGQGKKPSLVKMIAEIIFWPFLVSILCTMINLFLSVYATQFIVEHVIIYLKSEDPTELLISNGIGLAFLFFGIQAANALMESLSTTVERRIHLAVEVFLIDGVYEKSFHLSPSAKIKFTPGYILNIVNNDLASIVEGILAFNLAWSAPLQMILAFSLLVAKLGWVVSYALIFLAISLAATFGSSGLFLKSFTAALTADDNRITKIREFLYGIRSIKFRALEEYFKKQIQDLRTAQKNAIRQNISVMVGTQSFSNTLNPTVIFPSLVLFRNLQEPLRLAAIVMQGFTILFASWKRVSEFIFANEMPSDNVLERRESSNEQAIQLDKATFSYEQSEQELIPFSLREISLDIRKGSLTIVVGTVGSGKSSFLSAILGSIKKEAGSGFVAGSTSYCPQLPWILTGTIEKNILLGAEKDENRLNFVINSCGLENDISRLPNGILTEIGENGVNLSGGQKSRVQLARAIYSNSDIVLLDDPLASLDSRVGKQVFEDAILGQLKYRTRVLVTHQLHFLKQADQIVVLDQGRVVETGSYEELLSHHGIFNAFMKNVSTHAEEAEKQDDQDTIAEDIQDSQKEDIGKCEEELDITQFITTEDRAVGNVKWRVYKSYMKAIGYFWPVFIAFLFFMAVGASLTSQIYLAASATDSITPSSFILIYGLLGAISTVFYISEFWSAVFALIGGSNMLHDSALEGILRAPIAFFESQPIGRILNRLSSDVRSTDMEMLGVVMNLIASVRAFLLSFILIVQATWYIAIGLITCSVFFWLIYRYFQATNRELKRLSSITKSPLDSHVSESIAGSEVIRAFGRVDDFVKQEHNFVDDYQSSKFLKSSVEIWVRLRLRLLTCFISLALVLIGHFLKQSGGASTTQASAIGLALTASISFSEATYRLLVWMGMGEAEMNAIERLGEYGKLKSEGERHTMSDPEVEWPSFGTIEFHNIEIRYPSRPDFAVIKDLSLSVVGGEKVGIVGRTGSGKSTLITALFRLMELHDGKILIDGNDISQIGLKTLRSSLEIIPQDPVLFQGTIRSNIDLTNNYTDDQLWEALELVGLKDYISNQSDKLDSKVEQGGSNLSVGQRQLLCLCHAMLSKPKILILDEATSSIDSETDQLIQHVIKTQFNQITVLSIAHRLNTVAGFDKVLVLEDGIKMEYDSPYNLLQNPNSLFTELAEASGSANASIIREVASASI